MKQTIVSPIGMPTANLAINKSRLKIYNKVGSQPTYYLKKGQEFQIEIYNPTSDTILAKIHLNGKPITQGGLVIRQGERVFLDRYIDVPKKFLFDTYEVNNTAEVRKAIEDNGDFKVEFYKETISSYYNINYDKFTFVNPKPWGGCGIGINDNYNYGAKGIGIVDSVNCYYNNTGGSGIFNDQTTFTTSAIGITSSASASFNTNKGEPTLSVTPQEPLIKNLKRSRLKSIETGRVEKGSDSKQELKTVDEEFEYYSFHTVEYKMLPVSQQIATSEDLNVKRYCSNCGAKQKSTNKFCPSCGAKA